MKKLRGRCRLALSLAVMAMAVILLAPTAALGETAEPTGEPAPTAESPPASTGWVPQGGASEGSGGGSAPTQQGSSLGSGGSSGQSTPKQPAEPSEPPVPSAPPPAPVPSSDSYETEAAVEPAPEESVSAPAPEPEARTPEPTPEPAPPPHVAVDRADALLTGSGGVKGVSASSAAESASSVTAEVAPASGGLPWLALIVFSLILVVAGVRLVFGPIELDTLRYSRFKLVRRAAPRG